jgi:glycosyl-4,4'-diaponeurosporenoate acyltransferase
VPVKLPQGWIIALNLAGWPVIHLGLAWVFTRLPEGIFLTEQRWMRVRKWEERFYVRVLKVKHWKQLLPDGAPWLRGFAKRNLRSADPDYLRAFIAETRRGESAHWAMMLAGIVFVLWNPLWADVVMGAYAIGANLPCIVTQRFNQGRLMRALVLAGGR